SILFGPYRGGRMLFGHINFDTTPGMIQMSRMGVKSENSGRMGDILQLRPHTAGDDRGRISGKSVHVVNGAGRSNVGVGGGRYGPNLGSSNKISGLIPHNTSTRLMGLGGGGDRGRREDMDGGCRMSSSPTKGSGLGGSKLNSHDNLDDTSDNYCMMLKIKAAQALYRLSVEAETEVLSCLLNKAGVNELVTAMNVATALCRCTYEWRNHSFLFMDNTSQALIQNLQRHSPTLKVVSAKGILNLCGLSSETSIFSPKLDMYLMSLCSALEDLAKNESESVQWNARRPSTLACLASCVVNLASLESAHAHLVKQKDIVSVIRLLLTQPRLVE
ncbi:unnamed protein product, partial [Choristocarpus tenellus]